jgi:cytochrome c5
MKSTVRIFGALVIIALAASLTIPAVTGAADGKASFESAKCNMCHDVSTVGIKATVKSEKMKGPDLVGLSVDAATLKPYLKGETEINGTKHKKKFTGSEEELQAIVDWLVEQK